VVASDRDIEMQDANNTPSSVDEWGGMEAFLLRQRFLSLV
jgi:hypothetical protein